MTSLARDTFAQLDSSADSVFPNQFVLSLRTNYPQPFDQRGNSGHHMQQGRLVDVVYNLLYYPILSYPLPSYAILCCPIPINPFLLIPCINHYLGWNRRRGVFERINELVERRIGIGGKYPSSWSR